jgi:hypothetical protein
MFKPVAQTAVAMKPSLDCHFLKLGLGDAGYNRDERDVSRFVSCSLKVTH